jgi:hypothetical protein
LSSHAGTIKYCFHDGVFFENASPRAAHIRGFEPAGVQKVPIRGPIAVGGVAS